MWKTNVSSRVSQKKNEPRPRLKIQSLCGKSTACVTLWKSCGKYGKTAEKFSFTVGEEKISTSPWNSRSTAQSPRKSRGSADLFWKIRHFWERFCHVFHTCGKGCGKLLVSCWKVGKTSGKQIGFLYWFVFYPVISFFSSTSSESKMGSLRYFFSTVWIEERMVEWSFP